MPVSASRTLRVVSDDSQPPDGTGEPVSLDDAFRAHAAYVARVAFRALGRREEVDDIVQLTFLEAASALQTVRNPDAIRAWLATVAVRLSRRVLRRRRFKLWARFDERPDYLEVADPRSAPEERVMVAELYSILDTLSADDRLAWVLQKIEGEQLERVALVCECSLATAKRRIGRAQAAIERGLS
jgi:RNA polymerase sigma-70 factor, ECF subfamily